MTSSDFQPSDHRPTRRTFLKSSAVCATTAAATLSRTRPVHAAGSDRLKIGLIGCGGRGAGAVANALAVDPNARLIALADPFADRMQRSRQALQKRLGAQVELDDDHCFDGFEGYRRLLESGVDVAILAEPPHFRPPHIEACIDAGVHCFAEKPMAVDAPGVRSVLASGEKARRTNVSLVSGFETRYSVPAREAVQRIHDGQIGELVALQTTYNTGPLWHRGREPDWTEMRFQMRNWYYFTWLSGDHLVEQHVHYNDLVGWIMHEEPPLHAWGYGGREVRTEAKFGDIFDHHAVVYEYPDGVRFFAYTRQQPGCYNENSKLALGSKGRMFAQRGWSLQNLAGQSIWSPSGDPRHPEQNCFEEMFTAMKKGQPINDSLAMARSTMLAILGRMATHSGQRITWEEAFQSQRKLAPASYAWDADPPVLPGPDGQYPVPVPGLTDVL